MINLIRQDVSAAELSKPFTKPANTPLLPPLGDRAWADAAKNPLLQPLLAAIREQALKEVDQPLPVLTDELYADYFNTGNRLPFETPYFERRRLVARAAIATLVESDPSTRDRLMQSLIPKLTGVFDEVSWSLPAHVWKNPTGKDPMRIDLFAAETANLFGELLQVFGPAIPADLRKNVLHRLREKTWENFLARDFEWNTITNNWNAVCHQGVIGSALSLCDDAELLGKMLRKAGDGLKIFLSGFTADGGTSEGPGYWGYGFGWFMELNHQLEARSQQQLSLIDGDELTHSIAAFGPRMTLSNGFCVNFSDNSPRSTPRDSLLQYMAERYHDQFIDAHAEMAWKASLAKRNLNEQRADFFNLSRKVLRAPTQIDTTARLPDDNTLLPNLQVGLTRFHDGRGRMWEWAGKAGHNAEHHNHNDIGSYLLNIDGQRALIEIGAPEYNRAFFSSKRYESIAARSLGHPVPLINTVEQPEGKEFAGKVLAWEATDRRVMFKVDLTKAYPDTAGCKQCIRTIEIDKTAGRMTVTDVFDLDKTDAVETALIVEAPVERNGQTASVQFAPKMSLRITPLEGSTVAAVQRHEYHDHGGKPAHIDRIVIRPVKLEKKVSIGYSVDLA